MHDLPTISVVTTVYNKEKYIEDTIQSVLLAKRENVIEYIVIDDASTDSSWNKIKEIESQHLLIRAIRNETNLGDYGNRQKAVDLAKGEYIKFLDGDDMLYPHSIDVFNAALEQYPNCALFLSWNMINPPLPFPQLVSSRECFLREFLGHNSYLGVGPSAALIQKSAYFDAGGFGCERYVSDIELWRKIISKNDLCIVNPSLCYWRIHPEQESASEALDSQIRTKRLNSDLKWLKTIEPLLTNDEFKAASRRLENRILKNSIKTFLSRFFHPFYLTRHDTHNVSRNFNEISSN